MSPGQSDRVTCTAAFSAPTRAEFQGVKRTTSPFRIADSDAEEEWSTADNGAAAVTADGRRLACAEAADLDRPPVFVSRGIPGSRPDVKRLRQRRSGRPTTISVNLWGS